LPINCVHSRQSGMDQPAPEALRVPVHAVRGRVLQVWYANALVGRVYVSTYDPRMFADLAPAGEVVLVEQFDRCAEQEPPGRVTARGDLGYRLHQSATMVRYLIQSTLERGPRDSLTTVLAVDVEAGDAPIR